MSKLIEEIRKTNKKFEKIRLEQAEYIKSEKKLTSTFILNEHFSSEDEAVLTDFLSKKLPFANVNAVLKKSICDTDLVKNRTVAFLKEQCPLLKEKITAEDITAENSESSVMLTIKTESEVFDYLTARHIEEDLATYLNGFFCEDFCFSFVPSKQSNSSDLLKEEKVDYARIEKIPARYFKVNYVTRLWDADTSDEVMYIADAQDRTGELRIAGKIVNIREKTTKTGKPFFIIDFNDGTGRMSGMLFTNKEIMRRMEKLQEGSEVIVLGEGAVNDAGYHRFTIKSINYCELPKDFVYEERQSRKAPETYAVVAPTPVEELRQTSFFLQAESIPECFKGTSFVVVDLETTGTSPNDDKITEIGAVKMVDGKIIEKFATMVNPERKIPEVVVELTGITDEMVADAPKFADVAGDLFKFCDGSVIIAHNIGFDYTFIKNQSKPCDYLYANRGIDTLAVARALLPKLQNHKLNTVCEKFGIEFLHHRAYSDALATAQMFIELVRIKGSIPEYNV